VPPASFKDLLRKAAQQFRTQAEFAEALGISLARLNRALNKSEHALNPVNCLRLARITGDPPSVVLRAGGKADLAELIEQLYGRSEFTSEQKDLIELWSRVDDADDREAVRYLLERLAEPVNEESSARPRRPSPTARATQRRSRKR
jgi:transcriptional regulator with XRE-family HTH domain